MSKAPTWLKKVFVLYQPSLIMLCLQAWVQASFVRRDHKRHANLFSKIGGNKVGRVFFELNDCVLGDASCLLRDLQHQAASILPHEFHDPEDVLLFVGQESLTPPDFAYREALTLDEAKRALCMLSNAEQVDMMWDDNDAWATTKVNSLPRSLGHETTNTRLNLLNLQYMDHNEFPLEIATGQRQAQDNTSVVHVFGSPSQRTELFEAFGTRGRASSFSSCTERLGVLCKHHRHALYARPYTRRYQPIKQAQEFML